MKIIAYGVRPDEKDFFPKAASELEIDLTVTDKMLTEETAELAKGNDAIIVVTACKITKPVAAKINELGISYVLTRSAGFDHIDEEAIKQYGIRSANVPFYSAGAVPEFTVLLMLNLIRRIKPAMNKFSKRDYTISGILGSEISSMTLGLFGTGFIGCQSLRILNAMGAKILAYDPYPRDEAKKYATYVTQDEIFKSADLIFFHCNLTPETQGFINKEISKMKKGVFLVNTARGALMNFADVLEGLKSGHIAGLATDVYDNESLYFRKDLKGVPFDDKVLEELISLDNVIFTPHIAFYTETSVYNLIKFSLENALSFYKTGECKSEIYKA